MKEIGGILDQEDQTRSPIERLRVSDKLIITAIPIEHDISKLQRYGDQLSEQIARTDGTIFEYFPPELKSLNGVEEAEAYTVMKSWSCHFFLNFNRQ